MNFADRRDATKLKIGFGTWQRNFLYLGMLKNNEILLKIKQLISLTEPSATVILFGSNARTKARSNLILMFLSLLIRKEFPMLMSNESNIRFTT